MPRPLAQVPRIELGRRGFSVPVARPRACIKVPVFSRLSNDVKICLPYSHVEAPGQPPRHQTMPMDFGMLPCLLSHSCVTVHR